MVNIVVEDPPQPAVLPLPCDSTFELSQLEDMLVDKKSYGLFVGRSEAAYGIASGKRIHAGTPGVQHHG